MADAAAATDRIIAIFEACDLDSIDGAVAPDYVDHQGLGDVEIRGPDGFRKVVKAVHHNSDVRISVEDIVATEDKAAVRIRWTGVDTAGRRIDRQTLDLLRFAGGRLAEHWGAELVSQR